MWSLTPANYNDIYKFCVIVVQIKDELNNPTIDAVKSFKHRGHWQCCTSDVAGYMFRVCAFNF